MSAPLDIDAIAARAEAAPAGRWDAGLDCVQVPWCVPHDPDNFARTDDDTDDPLFSGRWLAVRESWWHTGSPDPGPELWEFLAAARGDVLELVAEVRRLRAAQRPAARRSPRPARYHRAGSQGAPERHLAAVAAVASPRRQASSGGRDRGAAADTVSDHSRLRTTRRPGRAIAAAAGGPEAGTRTGRSA